MSPASSPDSIVNAAHGELERELNRVVRLHELRRADPQLAAALDRLERWQAARLRQTYADLQAQPRYAAAVTFFETDLYGGNDFAQRDADVAKVAPLMAMMLPERVIATIAQAMELNAMSQELDRAMLAYLPRTERPFTVADYCAAYRAVGDRAARLRQIAIVGDIGAALDRFVRMPLVRGALAMMRQPARLAGMSVLHEFLERGFEAFRKMKGADFFLATIVEREQALMDAMLSGETAPFAPPDLGG